VSGSSSFWAARAEAYGRCIRVTKRGARRECSFGFGKWSRPSFPWTLTKRGKERVSRHCHKGLVREASLFWTAQVGNQPPSLLPQ
jgi:hypothetical protein